MAAEPLRASLLAWLMLRGNPRRKSAGVAERSSRFRPHCSSWFGGKARGVRTARFVDWGLLRRGFHPLFMTIVEVEYQDGERDNYFLPLAICGAADVKTLEERSPHGVLARVTGARKGVLFDGWLDNSFARAMLESLEHSQEIRMRRGAVMASRILRRKPAAVVGTVK